MGENLELLGEMDDAETLEEAEGGDGGVDIEAGGEAGAEDEAESFERAHGGDNGDVSRRHQISKYHERDWAGE